MTGASAAGRRGMLIVITVALGIAGAVAITLDRANDGDRERRVAEKSGEVMPFDLGETTHRFEPTADGGLEIVTADDPSDRREIELIQRHLREEAAAFDRGDFKDPAEIHGGDMPGLATLEGNAEGIRIEYRARADGAEIRYTATDQVLITALHDWFAAQSSDHVGAAG